MDLVDEVVAVAVGVARGARGHQRRDVGGAEPAERHVRDSRDPVEVGQEALQRLAGLLRSVRGEHGQRELRLAPLRDVAQERERVGVRPLQVVEDEQDRRVARDARQQRDHRVEQPEALALRVGGRWLRSGVERGHESRQLPAVAVQHVRRRDGGELGQRLDPRAVWWPQPLQGGAPAELEPLRVGSEREVRGKERLARTGLAAEAGNRPLAVGGRLQRLAQLCHLLGAADVRRHRPQHRRKRLRRLGERRVVRQDAALERAQLGPGRQSQLAQRRDRAPVRGERLLLAA